MNLNRKESILNLKNYFSPDIARSLSLISDMESVHEIRMRTDRPLSVASFGKERFLTEKGNLTEYPDMCRIVTHEDMEYSFKAVCDCSIYSYRREISEGFITLEGGNRVGICGTAVTENGRVSSLKYISGLNFRIAGQAFGCAEEICRRILKEGLCSVLIIGPPMSGKTTIIRDMCRIFGRTNRISIIDERGEIGAVYHGRAQNDAGRLSDIFDGYPKAEGIMTAVRVMSPDIVVCDEIGGQDDCTALLAAANTGVRIVASVHGSGLDGIKKRKYLDEVIESGIFKCFVTLGSGANTGRIKNFERTVI